MKQVTLKPIEGVPPGIGNYLSGMAEVREQLRDSVSGLSTEKLHQKLMPETHSIAQLILHCGEAEWWWIQCVVAGGEVDEELKQTVFWDVLEEDGEPPADLTAEGCISEVDRISQMSRELFSAYSDEDLDKFYVRERKDGSRTEFSLRWILHHLIDHEAQHKGQILMLKRLMGES